jgi:hypothetical protein
MSLDETCEPHLFLFFISASHISHERAIKKAALEEYKTNHPEKFHH